MTGHSVESVAVFGPSSKPQRPYVEVGIITSRPTGALSQANDGQVITDLRAKGAEIGCDGVIVFTGSTDAYVLAGSSQVQERRKFTASCIVFSDK